MDLNIEKNNSVAGSESEQEDFDGQIEYAMDASLDNLPLQNIGSPLAFLALSQNPTSISYFTEQQVQQQMQFHMLLQQQQANKNTKEESDFGSPSDIDLDIEQSKFPAPLETQKEHSRKRLGVQDIYSAFSIPQQLPSFPGVPQPNFIPLMYSYQPAGNLGIKRPDTALDNYLEREEADDLEKQQSSVPIHHFFTTSCNSPYAELSKTSLGLPTKILSPFAPQYTYGFPVGDSMQIPLNSAGSSCNQNSFVFDGSKDNRQIPATPKPQILTTDHGVSAPMSSMGMLINPIFMTGSSIFSPMEFNYLPSNELVSSACSWGENPFNPRYFNVPIPGMISMSKKDNEAYEIFKKTNKILTNEYDDPSIHVFSSVESKEKQNSETKTATRNNHENGKIVSDLNVIKPQVLLFNDGTHNNQTQYHLLPLSGATNKPLNSLFPNENEEAILKFASPVLQQNPKKHIKAHKEKPKSLNLNMDGSNMFDVDDVVVDYSDAIFGASKKYESSHLANHFTPPTANGNSYNIGDEHENDASENNVEYINFLVLREKAVELGFATDCTENDKMESFQNFNSQKKNVSSNLQEKMKPYTGTERSSYTMKPQYIETDFDFQESSLFTKSTKQVIDQIKHDALNNKSSKLVSFSPIHSSKVYSKINHNVSPLHTLTLSSSNQDNKRTPDILCAENVQSDTETSKRLPLLEREKMVHSTDYNNKNNYETKKTADLDRSLVAFKKKETIVNNNPVTKALQSTMNAILKNGLKKKTVLTKKSTKIKGINEDPLKKTKKKIIKSTFKNKGPSTLASNESIKTQFISATSGKQDQVNAAGSPQIDHITGSSLDTITPSATTLLPLEANDNGRNDPNQIINKLEIIFKNKKKTQRKPLINISNQILTSFGNLVVKSSDTNTDTTNNASLSWKKNMNDKNENVTESLLNDPNFTLEQLKKPKKGLFSCLHCSSKFSSILLYANHLDTVDLERPYKCPFSDCCWKYLGMTTTAKLKRHCALQHMPRLNAEMKKILSIDNNSYPEMKCSHRSCDKVFMRKDSIARHQQMVHDNTNSRFNQRQRKVMSLMKSNFSHLEESEKEVLIQQYMNGSLSLSNSNNPKTKKKSESKTNTLIDIKSDEKVENTCYNADEI